MIGVDECRRFVDQRRESFFDVLRVGFRPSVTRPRDLPIFDEEKGGDGEDPERVRHRVRRFVIEGFESEVKLAIEGVGGGHRVLRDGEDPCRWLVATPVVVHGQAHLTGRTRRLKPSCPTCQMGLPVYDHWRRYEPSARILAVSQDTVTATDALYGEFHLGFETFYDKPPYAMSNAFGVFAVPSLFLIEDGQVTWTGYGWAKADAEHIEERLATLVDKTPALVNADHLPSLKPG